MCAAAAAGQQGTATAHAPVPMDLAGVTTPHNSGGQGRQAEEPWPSSLRGAEQAGRALADLTVSCEGGQLEEHAWQ